MSNHTRKKRLLLVAPYSSKKVGGIGTWSINVLNYIRKEKLVEVCFQNTALNVEGVVQQNIVLRLPWGVVNSLRIILVTIKNLFVYKPSTVHYTSSASFALFKDYIIAYVSTKIFKVNFVIHWHFGRIPALRDENNWEWKWLLRVAKLCSNSIVIDKKSLVALQKFVPNVVFIPNPLSSSLENEAKMTSNHRMRPVRGRVVFLMPNGGKKYEKETPNLECFYFGEESRLKNKMCCLAYSLCRLFRFVHKGDTVLYHTFFPALFVIGSVPGLNILIENNEYPPFIFGKSKFGKFCLRRYLRVAKKAKQIFVISKRLREYFVSQGVSPDIVQVLNMTVDTGRFEGLVKQPVKCRYIAYCGTVSNYKDGVNVLLEAFAIVASKVPDVNLYILGGMPYEEDRRLNLRIVRENRLEDRVYMPGVVSADVLPQYLKNADVLALARPDNVQAAYGFPTKLGEYLLTGNPVVVTRVGELDDFLRDKESCLFARPDSVEDFAAQLLWVLANPDEAKRIGENGKRVAERCFNYSVEAQKIVRVLQELNAKS